MLITIQIDDVVIQVADAEISIEEVENVALDVWKRTRVGDEEDEETIN